MSLIFQEHAIPTSPLKRNLTSPDGERAYQNLWKLRGERLTYATMVRGDNPRSPVTESLISPITVATRQGSFAKFTLADHARRSANHSLHLRPTFIQFKLHRIS